MIDINKLTTTDKYEIIVNKKNIYLSIRNTYKVNTYKANTYKVKTAFKWRGIIYAANQYSELSGKYFAANNETGSIKLINASSIEEAAYLHCGDEFIYNNISYTKIHKGKVLPGNYVYCCGEFKVNISSNNSINNNSINNNSINNNGNNNSIIINDKITIKYVINIKIMNNIMLIITRNKINYLFYKNKLIPGAIFGTIKIFRRYNKYVVLNYYADKIIKHILPDKQNKLNRGLNIFDLPDITLCRDEKKIKFILRLKCCAAIKYLIIKSFIRIQFISMKNNGERI